MMASILAATVVLKLFEIVTEWDGMICVSGCT